MDKISRVEYVDASYTYDEDLSEAKLSVFEAHGYVEKVADNIVIIFIKKRGTNIQETIKNKENIVKGLVIPNSALISAVNINKNKILDGITEGLLVTVTWRDIVYVANTPTYDCATMYTEGTLVKIEKDHIILKNPETIRTYPFPVKNHPAEKPSYYTIPISLIAEIKVIK